MAHGVAGLGLLKTIFGLLLVLSVGGKILLSHESPLIAEANMDGAAKVDLLAFLDRQGFRVHSAKDSPESEFVSAAAGNCHLIASVIAPQGWNRSVLRQLAKGQDQLLFIYDGNFYPDQPVWLTWTDHYWRLLNRYAGRKLPFHPVLGIVGSSDCNLRNKPWRELSEPP
jgi:hypothetical protein